ncbi:hypothetical protein [Synechococcus sp. UW105]|uniref:hypothetical protein n=1 Tax=Synechococcus sp. UW105 TaxID=337067 RepID=UPI001FCAD4A1|nr:hypothetical protein [Synechococcus sp. UW105]
MQLQHLIVHDDRVTCIDAALVPDDYISGSTEEIRDLSFSFVTPLRTDDDNVGQRHCGPKPPICTIYDFRSSPRLQSKGVGELLRIG